MRLLLFNLATDADDPVLGFATRWIAALARHVEHIDVLTMRAGRVDLPANVRVYSLGKERGYSEPRRAFEFYRRLAHILRNGPIDACFSHMTPLFSVMAAPVLKPWRIPIITWYAHRQVTPTVKLAYHVSDRIVTSAASAFRYRGRKVSVIGQGIDTDLFCPGDTLPESPPLILSVGRLSPIKNTTALVEACSLLRDRGVAFRCAIVGPVVERDRAYAAALGARIRHLDLTSHVVVVGPVRHEELPAWYCRCSAHVNLSPMGLFDKSALEAMACGRPSLVTNAALVKPLGATGDMLLLADTQPASVASGIELVLAAGLRGRASLGGTLRLHVEERHGLATLANRVLRTVDALSS